MTVGSVSPACASLSDPVNHLDQLHRGLIGSCKDHICDLCLTPSLVQFCHIFEMVILKQL